MIELTVDVGTRGGYPVFIGSGVSDALAGTIASSGRRAAIITQPGIGFCVESGLESETFEIPVGERAKSLRTVEKLCSELSRWGMTRSDIVVAVGGGGVTDVAGFVAAIYHRGIEYVSVATSLLAQVDAAIGGKTGVNLAEGKNLVGAYWQPSAVFCDTDALKTLPPEERRSGLGEIAKYHFLGASGLDSMPLESQIARCVELKAAVVSADEREGGLRATLNYGHTLAHAIETAGGYGLRHGEAVAVGLVYAAEVAMRLDRIDLARVEEHRRVVGAYDLPSTIPAGLAPTELLGLFGRDKKALDGVTFMLDGPNGVEAVRNIDDALLLDALDACGGKD
ncbi:MAG: 3-dehydroquinate synthase [Acidobacteria bacterium]|nr:3-dehydroquinate synthase [Acidobacteriota bacterium]